jgi:hypothetical protein
VIVPPSVRDLAITHRRTFGTGAIRYSLLVVVVCSVAAGLSFPIAARTFEAGVYRDNPLATPSWRLPVSALPNEGSRHSKFSARSLLPLPL